MAGVHAEEDFSHHGDLEAEREREGEGRVQGCPTSFKDVPPDVTSSMMPHLLNVPPLPIDTISWGPSL